MAEFQGVSDSLFEEPEYRDSVELCVALYMITKRDMAGVVKIIPKRLATACRTSVRKVRAVLDYFESIGKLVRAKDGAHIWWSSGIYHSLYKGSYSKQQMTSVVSLLHQWQSKSIFSENFADEVVQLYAIKYTITIPYLLNMNMNMNMNKRAAPETEEEKKTIDSILTDFNQVTGSKLKLTTKPYRSAVRARLQEGYGLEDFKHVHRVKTADWMGTDMEKHLNPDTLYRPSNFPKYVLQKTQGDNYDRPPA